MSLLYKRSYSLAITDPETDTAIEFNDLRIRFDITKDLYGFPNLAKIEVFNLSEDTVAIISKSGANVLLSAGYGEEIKLIYKGEIKNILTLREGVDKVTTIWSGDGERAIKESHSSITFEAGTSAVEMVKKVASDMGVSEKILKGLDDKVGTLNGQTINTDTKEALNKLAEQYDFDWSIQDGAFITHAKDGFDATTEAVLISANSGMIGSPSITEIGVEVNTLLNTEIKPYRLIKVESSNPSIQQQANPFFADRKNIRTLGNGFYKVQKVIHKGDSRGSDWMTTVVGKRILT